jgi:hypothetical protein
MKSVFCASSVFPVCLAGLLLTAGCDIAADGGPGEQTPARPPDREVAVTPGIKQIMIKLARGPQALTSVIGNGLNADPIPWETLQAQTKEYAQSAAEMGKYDPSKGTKESWSKLTMAFAESAAGLDRAAQDKNKQSALSAHGQLRNSCNACHQQHRGRG